jgi:hypothetical protein
MDVVVELLWINAVMSNPTNKLMNGLVVTSRNELTVSLPTCPRAVTKRSIDNKKNIRAEDI